MAIFENKTEEQKTKPKTAGAGKSSAALRSAIIKPRISEKAAKSAEAGKYVFEVARKTNKIQIKRAIEQSYGVNVVSVNIITMEGKRRTSGRVAGQTSDFKKAIVTLKKGQTIDSPEAKI